MQVNDLKYRIWRSWSCSLLFFSGVARGPAFPGFDYNSERGSCAVQVQVTSGLRDVSNSRLALYANGAPTFGDHPAEATDIQTVLRLEDGRAIGVRCDVGRGTALLIGVHLEYDPRSDPEANSNELRPRNEALIADEQNRIQLFRELLSDTLKRHGWARIRKKPLDTTTNFSFSNYMYSYYNQTTKIRYIDQLHLYYTCLLFFERFLAQKFENSHIFCMCVLACIRYRLLKNYFALEIKLLLNLSKLLQFLLLQL